MLLKVSGAETNVCYYSYSPYHSMFYFVVGDELGGWNLRGGARADGQGQGGGGTKWD